MQGTNRKEELKETLGAESRDRLAETGIGGVSAMVRACQPTRP